MELKKTQLNIHIVHLKDYFLCVKTIKIINQDEHLNVLLK